MEGRLGQGLKVVNVSVRRDKDDLSLHSVELPLDGANQIFKKLFMSKVSTSLIRMLDENISSADILVINVNKRPH